MEVIKQDSLVVKEIEKRQEVLKEFGAKVERRVALEQELELLNKEISETDPVRLELEIQEFTDYAIKLGHIAAPVVPEEVKADDSEDTTDTVAPQSYQSNTL